MTQGFEALNDQQYEVLKDAISWITALIAGADGKIDSKETAWAEKLTHIRSYANETSLNDFYSSVGENFSERLSGLIESLPESTEERTALLSRKLSEVNDILPCIDNILAVDLYKSYKSFAKHVAKVSGGFLGMMSISKDESVLIELPMIQPIEYIAEEEE